MAVSRSGYGRLDGILMQWSAERDAICPRILTLKSSDGYKRSVPLLIPVPPLYCSRSIPKTWVYAQTGNFGSSLGLP